MPNLGLVSGLDLRDPNGLSDPADSDWAAPGLTGAWGAWTGLTWLDLSRNLMGEAGLRAVPWGGFAPLVKLKLSHNALGDAAVIHLLNTGVLRRVEELDLRANELTDQSAYELADRLGKTSPVRSLRLQSNRLAAPGQNALLERFGGRVELF